MITPAYIKEMAAYNRWQNDTLYALCAGLGEAARRAPRELFFESIHDTLEHLLHIDGLIVAYLRDGAPPDLTGGRPTWPFDDLQAARRRLDDDIAGLTALATPSWVDAILPLGGGRTGSRGLMLVQMFNHQTHHRSQITAHLHLMGVDYGCTDLPYRPGR